MSLTREQAVKRICLALDFSEPESAVSFAKRVKGHVGILKIGLELFCAGGRRVVQEVQDEGFSVFLDLKLHDIPNTVAGAARVVSRFGVDLLTVHASGGAEMLSAAVRASAEGAAASNHPAPRIVGITVLTSLNDSLLSETLGISTGVERTALGLAAVAANAGLAGVVASAHEIAALRRSCGPDFLIITPGIRLPTDEAGDQKRVMTPGEAIRAGADLLVVGRPIRNAKDPVEAAHLIAADMQRD